ncbi:MAG: ATP-binding protein [Planctomycetes bacterium]|nr:ATP-binding protein [Planctomycetota bacterium]
MDPITNPFSPGAGSPPRELAGREPILEQARILLGRLRAKRPEKSMVLTGLRGVGKTVLLNEIARRARADGCRTISIEAHEGKPMAPLLATSLKGLLFDLDRVAGVGQKVKRALRVLRSFLGALTVKYKYADVSVEIDIDPEPGSADSGDIELDLPKLFVAVGEAAEERQCAVALLIDEIQYFTQKELGALIMAMHQAQQHQIPVALIAAGLPVLPGLAGESKSYAERLFAFPEVGALSEAESERALQQPARLAGVEFDRDALREIYDKTQGYPYFLQEWGYQAWNLATVSPIALQVILDATVAVSGRLDRNFFRVRFDRLTPREKRFLRAMAEAGPGPRRTGDVADILGVKITSLGPLRAQMIRKGMVYSPAHGELAFTVPRFDEFICRAVPKDEIRGR